VNSENLPKVGHTRLDCSLAEFEHRCRVLLNDEQRRASPDTALIALLCDAVGLAREHDLTRLSARGSSYREGVIVGAAGAREETAKRCAEIAGQISGSAWADYMGSDGERRGDPHWRGVSDGAADAAAQIRREFGLEATR
jgi:hypothetical protein